MIGLGVHSDILEAGGKNHADPARNPTDDAYLSQIEQYKGNADLFKALQNNPWLYSNQAQFSPTFFQSIGEWLGDYSSRDRYYADLKSKQSQYLADMVQQYTQRDYDSATAQAARERAAGLNPDLNGQVTPGASAENDQPIQPGSSMDMGTDYMQVGQGAMNFLSFILSGAQALQGLNIGEETFVTNELANNQNALNFIMNSKGLTGKYKDYSIPDFDVVSDDEIIAAIKEAPLEGYSRRTRKYLDRFFKQLTPDSLAVQSVRENLRTQIAEARKRRVEVEGSPTYSDDFQTWVNNYARKIGNFEYETWKIEQLALRRGWSADKLEHELRIVQNEAENDLFNFVRGGNKWYNTLGILGLPYLRNGLNTAITSGINFLSARGLKRMPNLNQSSSSSTSYVHTFKH